MNRHTEDHDPEPHEIEAFTQPDVHLPGDGSLTWLGIIGGLAIGLSFWACIIGLIVWVLGGIFSW